MSAAWTLDPANTGGADTLWAPLVVTLASANVAGNGTYRLVRSFGPGTYDLFVEMPAGPNNTTGRTALHRTVIR
jgi:hypothetical protein